MAGTSEGTVVQFQFLSSNVDQENKDWVRTRTFKNHSHDVRALVHLESAVVSGGQSVCRCLPERRPGEPDRHARLIPAGMDTQLVVRPLLDKVEKNTHESALRKITFPHVSTSGTYLRPECPRTSCRSITPAFRFLTEKSGFLRKDGRTAALPVH